ncbi:MULTISPECIES: hypothetical protein [unclassified Mucilaginibacter]|uniref:hypothetical protein n=1 Tax=unclassified Mucilaginibacter TaxID=2617802 RepID=UPI0009695062|nr:MULTISPECIES: hypothetical protein [unclassified Mucilaginibacter]OJW13289.1 MAG: hypothetical protein BGO48_00570 [Mucilaginibacter sp. 44-25]PLW88564.1 MAG: hypothetical protein C0154_15990 [Mucilaginibacter sp.]HEK20125.1 hypothetical protein [Bacteroidota bacterium]
MLLGSNQAAQNRSNTAENDLIARLIGQELYAEAYALLIQERADQTVTQYNLALCFYAAGCYNEALVCLDKAQLYMPLNQANRNTVTDGFYRALLDKQKQLNDHLFAVTSKHLQLLPQQVTDGIIRLKTDCWMQLGNYAKILETATPIAYKQYGNITEALAVAKKHLNQ